MPHRATRADVDEMASIHAAAFPANEAWSRDVFDLQLALPFVFGLMHGAAGFILVRIAADEAEVLTLAVLPDLRRAGIGASLLEEATTVAIAAGVRTIFLEVSVANIAARSLYTKAGFNQVGRRPHYYSDRSDALVLRFDVQAPLES